VSFDWDGTGCRGEPDCGSDQSPPKSIDELVRHFESRIGRRPILATTRTPSGQTLDWVPVESQVSGGAIATPPPLPESPAPPPDEAIALASFELEDQRVARGPEGSVPIVRKDLAKVAKAVPIVRYMAKRSPDGRHQSNQEHGPLPPDPRGSFIHCTSGQGTSCWGGDGVLNVWAPSTETFEDHSVMQMGSRILNEPQTQAVEAGWIVCQQLNGDGLPHLFTYYTTNGYGAGADNVGGYNLEFDGWVQYDPSIYPGALIAPSSDLRDLLRGSCGRNSGHGRQTEVPPIWRAVVIGPDTDAAWSAATLSVAAIAEHAADATIALDHESSTLSSRTSVCVRRPEGIPGLDVDNEVAVVLAHQRAVGVTLCPGRPNRSSLRVVTFIYNKVAIGLHYPGAGIRSAGICRPDRLGVCRTAESVLEQIPS
jgi:Neprosin